MVSTFVESLILLFKKKGAQSALAQQVDFNQSGAWECDALAAFSIAVDERSGQFRAELTPAKVTKTKKGKKEN